MLQNNLISHIYNPDNQTQDELIENFVIREKEFKKIFKDISNSTMQNPEQHYIIQGQRGQGKTTLILRLYYEILNSEVLKEWLIPIKFSEEQYNIRTLSKLWENIAEELEDIEGFEELYEEFENSFDNSDYEESSFFILEESLKQNQKKIIVFIDNIGDIFKRLNNKEEQRFREILLTSSEIRIIGTSSIVLESTYDYSKPFYEFFKIINLVGLNREETETLLLNLSKHYNESAVEEIIKNEPQRLELLRRLTSGVPRTIVLLFEIFADNKDGNSFKDLEILLDRVTPLYKHRMDDLSPQQQEIIHTIAINWDGMSTKEIATKTRLESKAISSQLKLLEKNSIVEKVPIDKKNYFYLIKERFFNIWYLMRYGKRRDKSRVLWLIKFLEGWCSQKEIITRAKNHINMLKNSKVYDKFALYLSETYAHLLKDDNLQHELITTTREVLKDKKELLKELSNSDKELYEEADKLYEKGEYKKTLKKLLEIKHQNKKVLYNIAYLYRNLKEYKKAEEYYLMAIEKGHIEAILNLAYLYFIQKIKKEEALKYAKLAYEKRQNNRETSFLSFIFLWNNQIEESIKIQKAFLNHKEAFEEFNWAIENYLLILISKKQYHSTLELFNEYNLKERFKPIYYALMKLMNNEKEFKRMGSEISQTVEEILKRIKILAEEYK